MGKEYLSIQERKLASLEALICLDGFCKKNDLSYFLAYGTLIGAVRHKGFIPWDDDIDVWIPRTDYEKLISSFESSDHFRLVSVETDRSYMFPYAKLENLRTARVVRGELHDGHGIGIDIYPLDGIPSPSGKERRLYGLKRKVCETVVNRFDFYSRLPSTSLFNRIRRASGSVFLKSGLLRKLAEWVNDNACTTDYATSEEVAFTVDAYVPEMYVYKREWFNKVYCEFEGYMLPIPGHYNEILTEQYGDYMTPPPPSQQVTTHTDEFIWREDA